MVNELQEVQWAYLIDPCFQIENTAGRPNTGGWINIYIAGTRTKYYAASDFSGTLHPFNIPLDSLGSNIILVSPANKYDIYILNKFGTLVMSRYNVSPQVAGTSIVSGGVVLDSSDGTITIEQTGDNVYDLSVSDIIDSVTASFDESITNIEGDIAGLVSGKKDIQAPYSASGSPTKTVTSVTQDANGVITVTYSDIDLPQQVPNIEIESSTLDVVSSIDPETNTKTFTIDTRSVTGDASFAYGDPTDTSYIVSPHTSPVKLAGSSPTRMAGNDISYDGTDKQFTLKAGVYFVNFNVEASTNSVDDSTQQVYAEIASNGTVHDRGTVTVDRTVSGQKSEIDLSSIIFAPNDNYVIEVDMGADSDVAIYGRISHWDIFRIDRGGISGGSVPGHEYLAGWGIEINQDDEISVDPTILDQYVTQEELTSAVSGLAPEYTAGDNIVIDNNTISLSDVVTIHAREGQSSGSMAFGNITHWGDQDYGPGWAISAHTDRGVDYHSFNTCDKGLQAFYWGDYDLDRDTGSVSGQSTITISEGDIKYQQGDFQSTDTLPVIWSCSQMAQDISELQEAITAVSGSFVQEQSDWTETNSDSPTYIKHKPDLEDYTSLEQFYETMNSSIADWAETTASAYSFIKNKPEEKELVAGENIVITENASAIIINSTGGGGGGSDVFAGDGIEIVSGVISVDNTVVRDQEFETASGSLVAYTDTVSGNLVDYIDGIDKDAVFWVGSSTTYQAITDAIAANKIPVYLDPQSPTTYGYLNEKGSKYYWFMAYKFLDKQLADYDIVYNYFIYSDDRHSNTVGYTGIHTVAGNGIDITRTYSSQSKQGFQTVSIDAAEIASSISGLIPTGSNYTAGDNIDITNNVISVSGTEDLTLMNLTAGEGISITPDVSGNVEIACTSTGVTKTLLYTGSSTDSRNGTFTLSQSGYNFDRLEMTLIDVDNYVIKQVCEMPADGLVNSSGTRGSSFNSITRGTQTWFKAMNWQLDYAGTTLRYWVDEIATSGNSVTAINRDQYLNRPIMLRIYGIKE